MPFVRAGLFVTNIMRIIFCATDLQSVDDTGEKMNKAEKERVAELIFKYYKKFYNPNVIWVDKFC